MIRELIDTDLEAVAGGFDVNQFLTNVQGNFASQGAAAATAGDNSPATAVTVSYTHLTLPTTPYV